MPSPVDKVEVYGVKELQRELMRVDSQLPRKMKEGFLQVAEKVAAATRSKVPVSSGKQGRYPSGSARASVEARATQQGAAIKIGGRSAPYYPWLDFGGSTGPGHQVGVGGSGSIKRPFIREGRYLYPTIRDHSQQIKDDTERMMDELNDTIKWSTPNR